MDVHGLTGDQLVGLLERMILVRRFEERAAEERAAGFVPGFLHPYIGQEAVAVGACAALGPDDVITSTHRGHGHMIARGAAPRRMFAELFARVDGYNHAKGGSLHMIDAELGFLGANGIVGGGIPLAAGAALQLQRDGSSGIAVSFFGDGATNQGAFHETLNLASLWKLPVVFLCENNLYGEFTRQDQHQPISDIADRADSYAMPGAITDGNDVLDVLRVVTEASERARAQEGPTLVEAKTYRHRGHYEGDMGRYRPEEEVEAWLARDPIRTFEHRLVREIGVADEDAVAAVHDHVETMLDEAIDWAKQSPHPQPASALQDVYRDTVGGAVLR